MCLRYPETRNLLLRFVELCWLPIYLDFKMDLIALNFSVLELLYYISIYSVFRDLVSTYPIENGCCLDTRQKIFEPRGIGT